jgi:RNA polymerase sigma factor (sigma-70 family)
MHLPPVNAARDIPVNDAFARGRGLEELYRRHVGRAVSLAGLMTGDYDAAEDIAHDAFIRVAGRFGHLRDEAAFEAYYRRAVVNLCRARFRRLRLERAYVRRHATGTAEVVADHEPEERDLLWAAIERLPHRQRLAVVLRFYEDLSEDQTGQVLHCSARAVNSLVSRAMAQLRADVEEES